MKLGIWVLLAILASCGVTQLGANTITFDATLSGAFEVPPNMSPGTGFAIVTIDDIADTVWVDLTYSGLTAPASNAHIHCCAVPGVGAPVAIPFIPGGFVTGSTSGTFTATFSNVSPAILAGLENGLGYINVHTANFPAGEIRGNLTPEPGTIALLGLGLAGLFAIRRRKKPSRSGLFPA